MAKTEKVSNLAIGMADITIDGKEVPRFADAATFNAEPQLQDIDLYTAPNYDKLIEGWDVSCKIVTDEDSLEFYKMALSGAKKVDDDGLTDAPAFDSMRDKAKEVKIHPQNMGDDTSLDITIHMAIAVGEFEKTYGKEVEGYEIELQGLHRTGDYRRSSNYFTIGEVDVDELDDEFEKEHEDEDEEDSE